MAMPSSDSDSQPPEKSAIQKILYPDQEELPENFEVGVAIKSRTTSGKIMLMIALSQLSSSIQGYALNKLEYTYSYILSS
jgi:hypothetical protein